MRTLRRNAASDRNHRRQWPHPREPRAAITGAGQSCHKISRQRMMTMKIRLASGAASAHRYNLAPSTLIFQTRIQPCRIAVRAEIEKCEQFGKKRPHLGAGYRSLSADLCRIPALGQRHLRFSEHCQLKTADSQRRCGLRFPYGTGRCNFTGLLEQMP